MPEPEPPFERLHPYSLLFQVGAQLRALVVPAVVYLFAGEGSPLRFLILLFVLPTLIQPILHFLSFRYQLRRNEMVVREGVLFRNERRIPYSRIHNVDMVQNPLHRLVGVAMVRLETASGGKPEAVMRVLSLEALDRLRTTVRARDENELRGLPRAPGHDGKAIGAGEEEAETSLLELSPGELVRLGLISNQGLVVVAGVVGLAFQQNWIDWEKLDPEKAAGSLAWIEGAPGLAQLVDRIGDTAASGSWLLGALLAGAAATVMLVALYLFSILLAFLRFWGFRLVRQGEQLRARMGLLTRVTQTTPRRRIQHLRVHQGPIHRLFDRSSIRIDTAGGSGEPSSSGFQPQGAGASSRQWLAPLIASERAGSLVEQALPDLGIRLDRVGVATDQEDRAAKVSGNPTEALDWQPIERRAWKRRFRRAAAFTLVATAAASWLSPWGLSILLLIPLQLVLARRYVRCRSYLTTDHAILWRSGWWRRNLSIVLFSKIQTVLLLQSPFDRRHHMASVRIDTAGAGRAAVVDIPYLDFEVARTLADRLHREAAGRAFQWS